MSEVRAVDIPGEAYDATVNVPDADSDLRGVVEAAAPFIDRAARIDVLRELAAEDQREYERIKALLSQRDVTMPPDSPLWNKEIEHYRSMTRFRARIAELEVQ